MGGRHRLTLWLGLGAAAVSPLLLAMECEDTCIDGVLNGTETDIDCGGDLCGPCSPSISCTQGSECESDECSSGVCVPACEQASDCVDGVCDVPPMETEGKCVKATCSDGVLNGDEVFQDCGADAGADAGCDPCGVPGCSDPICSVTLQPYVGEDEDTEDRRYAQADRLRYYKDDPSAQFIGAFTGAEVQALKDHVDPDKRPVEIRAQLRSATNNNIDRVTIDLPSTTSEDFTTKASAIVDIPALVAQEGTGTFEMRFRLRDENGSIPAAGPVRFYEDVEFEVLADKRPEVAWQDVSLVVEEQSLVEDIGWPITTGIPLPEGMVAVPDRLRLLVDGAVTPAQFRTLSSYHAGGGGTLRWVGVDFLAPNNDAHEYKVVRTTELGSVTHADAVTVTHVQTSPERYEVVNGDLSFSVLIDGFDGVREAWLDAGGDGGFGEGDKIVESGGGPFATDSESSEVYGPGTTCSSTDPDDPNPTVTLEVEGPVRATIRADGCLVDTSGATMARYVTRITTFAGMPTLRVDHQTIITANNDDPIPSTGLDGAGFELKTLGGDEAKAGVWRLVTQDGGAQVEELVVDDLTWPGSGQGVSVHQVRGDLVEFHGNQLADGVRSDGWIATSSKDNHWVLMTVKDFYQRFPQELEVFGTANGASLTLHQWPKNGATLQGVDDLDRKEIHKAWYAHSGAGLDLRLPNDTYRDKLEAINWQGGACDTCDDFQTAPGDCNLCNEVNCPNECNASACTAELPPGYCDSEESCATGSGGSGGDCDDPTPAADFTDDDDFACECDITRAAKASGIGLVLGNRIEYVWMSNPSSTDLANRAQLFQEDPHATATPAWNGSSGVLGKLHPKDSTTFPEIEKGLERMYPGWHAFSEARGQVGKWVYADLHHAWNAEQDAPDLHRLYQASHYANTSQAWIHYFRSGDPAHLAWARANTETLVNTHVNHMSTPGTEEDGAYPAGGIDHTKGILPWGSNNGSQNHAGDAEALLLSYYLTGDTWALDAHRLWRGAVNETFPQTSKFGRDMATALGGFLSAYAADHDPQMIRFFREHVGTAIQKDLVPDNNASAGTAVWHPRWVEYARQQVRDPDLDTAVTGFVDDNNPMINPSLHAIAYDISEDDKYLKNWPFEKAYDLAHVYYDNTADPDYHGMSLASQAPFMRVLHGLPHYLRALEEADVVPANPLAGNGSYPHDSAPDEISPGEYDHSVELLLLFDNCTGMQEDVVVTVVTDKAKPYELWRPNQTPGTGTPEASGTTSTSGTDITLTWTCAQSAPELFTLWCYGRCIIEAPVMLQGSSTDHIPQAFVMKKHDNGDHSYENWDRFNFYVDVEDTAPTPTLTFRARQDDQSLPAFVRVHDTATPTPLLLKETTLFLIPNGLSGTLPREEEDVILNQTAPWHIYSYSDAGPIMELSGNTGLDALYVAPTKDDLTDVINAL